MRDDLPHDKHWQVCQRARRGTEPDLGDVQAEPLEVKPAVE